MLALGAAGELVDVDMEVPLNKKKGKSMPRRGLGNPRGLITDRTLRLLRVPSHLAMLEPNGGWVRASSRTCVLTSQQESDNILHDFLGFVKFILKNQLFIRYSRIANAV